MLQKLEREDRVQAFQLAPVLGEPKLLHATRQCPVISPPPPPVEVLLDAEQSCDIR